MKRKVKSVCLSLAILVLTACGSGDDNRVINTGVKSTLKETLDTYIDTNIKMTDPGVIVAFNVGTEYEYLKARGMANKNTNKEIGADTTFSLASLSKPFTAIAILQLVEQGAISTNDKLLTHLPEFSPSWGEITIHHLLTHQSGIPDYYNDDVSLGVSEITNESIFNYFIDKPKLHFAAGTKTRYSNTGYVLLAEIVSRVSGMSFDDYMRTFVFEPSGMLSSFIKEDGKLIKDNDALSFAKTVKLFGKYGSSYGDSGQASSINDLISFSKTLKNNTLMSKESYSLMIKEHTQMPSGARIGYGTQSGIFSFGGSNDGFRTMSFIDPERDFYLHILSNGGDRTQKHNEEIVKLISSFYDIYDIKSNS